jgi:hypothetical protein
LSLAGFVALLAQDLRGEADGQQSKTQSFQNGHSQVVRFVRYRVTQLSAHVGTGRRPYCQAVSGFLNSRSCEVSLDRVQIAKADSPLPA